ncbi:MAG: hypothetical protein ACOY3J_11985 [Bacillota bacterium]|uniref:Formamidopyrimidine-DNA glycosylase H2TH DNA-binding domain-containing protein n=1 Tax=Thermanaerosceptrum fracticalcis TaxID=1712410 RepID=A0A7G6E2X9_THEFR|nr:hypothetical protein [Thermanaerosceptrum fracticalcis]QNB46433.1 hypothetical protein BR63_08980 [Thermanaerosceptrum fracticalcis]
MFNPTLQRHLGAGLGCCYRKSKNVSLGCFKWFPWKGALKPLLTDQEFIAGIGNCYSDEILFAAGIRPDRKANELDREEVSRLYSAIPGTLEETIRNGGYMDKP